MDFVRRHWMAVIGLVVLSAPLLAGLNRRPAPSTAAADSESGELTASPDMVYIPTGRFVMGSSISDRHDEWPPHDVATDAYRIDVAPVTNAQFERFVESTGHVTTAEQRGSSLVFDLDAKTWNQTAGATWQSPQGPGSTLEGRSRHPVVHVSWHDARAFAQWAGKRLATEAEYERAARGGLLGKTYSWGDEIAPDNQPMANFWQGRFPYADRELDRFGGASPVGRFPPNRYGLIDIAGNTWCWVADGYDAEFYQSSPSENPRGPVTAAERVLRGGSYLTPASSMTVATRGHAPPEHTSCDVGFRCVR